MGRRGEAQPQSVSAGPWVLRLRGHGLRGVAVRAMQKEPRSGLAGKHRLPVTVLQELEAEHISWKQQSWHRSLPNPVVSAAISPWRCDALPPPPTGDSAATAPRGNVTAGQRSCNPGRCRGSIFKSKYCGLKACSFFYRREREIFLVCRFFS